MEKIKFDVKVYDNYLEIIPLSPMKDNSTYTITIKGLKSENGDIFSGKYVISTKLTPLYSDIYAVRSIIDGIEIPDDVILYHIREASRFVDYMKNGMSIDENKVPFEVSQFVKYHAAHECILRHNVHTSSSIGMKGTVGNVSFEEKESNRDISNLLCTLRKEADKWKDEVRGFKLEGRAKLLSAVKGAKSNPAFTSPNIDFERGV